MGVVLAKLWVLIYWAACEFVPFVIIILYELSRCTVWFKPDRGWYSVWIEEEDPTRLVPSSLDAAFLSGVFLLKVGWVVWLLFDHTFVFLLKHFVAPKLEWVNKFFGPLLMARCARKFDWVGIFNELWLVESQLKSAARIGWKLVEVRVTIGLASAAIWTLREFRHE